MQGSGVGADKWWAGGGEVWAVKDATARAGLRERAGVEVAWSKKRIERSRRSRGGRRDKVVVGLLGRVSRMVGGGRDPDDATSGGFVSFPFHNRVDLHSMFKMHPRP